jgi:Protein of unknown function (DUF1559)
MHRFAVLLPLLLSLAAPVHAADRKFDPVAAAKVIAPFLDDRTVAVVHVDLTRLDVDAIAKRLADLANIKVEEIEEKKAVSDTLQALLKAGAKDLFVVVSVSDLPTDMPFLVLPVEKDADAKAILELLPKPVGLHSYGTLPYRFEQIGKAVVGGGEWTRKRLKTLKPEARPEVAKAFAASGDGVARAVLFATTDTRKILEETLPTLPPEVGGGSIKVLTRGLKWVAVWIDAPPQMNVHWLWQTADKDSAKELDELLKRSVKFLGQLKELREVVPNADKLLEAFVPHIDGDQLTLTMDDAALAKILGPVLQKMREEARRSTAVHSMKQLGIASHSYHDANGHLPAVANFDKQNKPLLSWRVHLLPYLEQNDLYKQFHLDEPWDSEHNKKLIAKMPKVFANPTHPKLAAEGKTTYVAPVHSTAIFTGDLQGSRFADITDGTSQTILLVDVEEADAVIWTKPDDLKLDPKSPAKGLSPRFGDRYTFLFADASVQFVSKKIDKAMLWALFTKSGGEVVNLP